MKNSVLRVLFRRTKGRNRRSLPLLLSLALLAAVLCGCDGQKAKVGASTDGQASETTESVAERTPQTEGEPPQVEAPAEGEPPQVEASAEGEWPEGGTPTGEQPPEGEFPASPSANDEWVVTFSGFSNQINEISGIIAAISEKTRTFDEKLTQISNDLKTLNRTKGGVSAPVFIASLLLVCALSAGLTTAIVIRSFNGKFEELEAQIREQRQATHQETESLQTAISKTTTRQDLVTVTNVLRQDMSKLHIGQSGQKAAGAQAVRNVPAKEPPPKKEYYEVFPPHSSADMTILKKSETHQPIVGWMSAKTLILEPALDEGRKCSVDNLYSEQMTACFAIRPHDPVGSADFYAVDIDKSAEATFVDGRYVLSAQGQLTARI